MRFNNQEKIQSLNWLELLRFLCAISVLIWHYQHFFHNQTEVAFVKNQQPFFDLFKLFYTSGGSAVRIFWLLSGFIFCWKYSDSIYSGTTTLRKFVISRFSRLYPLHISTLLLIAILQYLYLNSHNEYFVYQNDIKYFILNIFFASSWLDKFEFSFNGPIWSVSVEVLVYLLFFLFSYFFARRNLAILAICILCVIGIKFKLPINNIISCAYCFFAGMFCYQVFDFSCQKITSRLHFLCIVLVAILIAKFVNLHSDIIYFFLLVLCFALMDKILPLKMIKFSVLGNMTYSSYLIHFPVQIIFVMLSDYMGFSRSLYYSDISFIVFILTTFILSYFIYKYFERPAQHRIRMILK